MESSILLPVNVADLRSRIELWEEELVQAGSSFRICWNLHPAFFAWMGPVIAHHPRTPFLQQRLGTIPVWAFVQEVVSVGDKPSDTIVNRGKRGWEIFLRPSRYLANMQQELQGQDASFLQVLTWIGDPEQLILWRQEMNLTHEWGHRITDQKIAYRDPLLDRLVPFPPDVAWKLYAFVQGWLEALAEWFPQEGVFFLITELAQQPGQEKLARGLLLDRLRDLSRQGLSAFLPFLEPLILPHLQEPALPWPKIERWCTQVGTILQETLWQSIKSIPTSDVLTEAHITAWQNEQLRSWRSRMQSC